MLKGLDLAPESKLLRAAGSGRAGICQETCKESDAASAVAAQRIRQGPRLPPVSVRPTDGARGEGGRGS